jgi:hypothetical protein
MTKGAADSEASGQFAAIGKVVRPVSRKHRR